MAAAVLLGDALRANDTVQVLSLSWPIWEHPAVVVTVMRSLASHRSIRRLQIVSFGGGSVPIEHRAAVGAAIAALVAANARALNLLHIFGAGLGLEGLRCVLDALPANTHLGFLRMTDADELALPAEARAAFARPSAGFGVSGAHAGDRLRTLEERAIL